MTGPSRRAKWWVVLLAALIATLLCVPGSAGGATRDAVVRYQTYLVDDGVTVTLDIKVTSKVRRCVPGKAEALFFFRPPPDQERGDVGISLVRSNWLRIPRVGFGHFRKVWGVNEQVSTHYTQPYEDTGPSGMGTAFIEGYPGADIDYAAPRKVRTGTSIIRCKAKGPPWTKSDVDAAPTPPERT